MPLSVASTCVLLLSVFTSVCGVMDCLLLSSVQWHESSIGNTIASIALSDVGLLFAGSTNGLMFAIGAYTPYGPSPSSQPTPGGPSGGGLTPGGKAVVALTVLAVIAGAAFFAYKKWGHRLPARLQSGGAAAAAGSKGAYLGGGSSAYATI